MLNFNKFLKNFPKFNFRRHFSTINETYDKQKILKKKRLSLNRDEMNINFQLLKKSDSQNMNSLFYDGYVFLEIKQANTTWVKITYLGSQFKKSFQFCTRKRKHFINPPS
jgi:hypothetical protein